MSDTPQVLLEHRLKTLKLPTFLREYEKVARRSAHEGLDHVEFLSRLVELELIDRERRLVERRIKAAKFPTVKSLDSFEFKAIPSLNKVQVLELARCEWIERRENVIALGPSGTGKTHVAQGLGLAACQRELSVRFVTAAALVHARDDARVLWLITDVDSALAEYALIQGEALSAIAKAQAEAGDFDGALATAGSIHEKYANPFIRAEAFHDIAKVQAEAGDTVAVAHQNDRQRLAELGEQHPRGPRATCGVDVHAHRVLAQTQPQPAARILPALAAHMNHPARLVALDQARRTLALGNRLIKGLEHPQQPRLGVGQRARRNRYAHRSQRPCHRAQRAMIRVALQHKPRPHAHP